MNRAMLVGILTAVALTACATSKNQTEVESLVDRVQRSPGGVPDCGPGGLAFCQADGSRIQRLHERGRSCSCFPARELADQMRLYR